MVPRYLSCTVLVALCVSLTTTRGYILLYPGLPLMSPSSSPWLGSFLPSRTVINFSAEDCSGGDGLKPVPGSGCWQYYVCSAGRVRAVW